METDKNYSKLAKSKEEKDFKYDYNPQKSRNKTPFMWPFIFALLLCGFLAYQYYKNNLSAEAKEQKEYFATLDDSVSVLNTTKDSLVLELNNYENQISELNTKMEQLNLNNSSLKNQLSAKAAHIRRLINQGGSGPSGSSSNYNIIRKELDQLKETLEKERLNFRKTKDSLENILLGKNKAIGELEDDLSTTKNEKQNILAEKEYLEDQLAQSTQLKIKDVDFYAIRERNKGDEPTEKAKKASRILFQGTIFGTELAQNGSKEIVLRILGTAGEILSNNNDELVDKNTVITDKKTIRFNGQPSNIKFDFTPKVKFKAGTYKAELLENGKLITTQKFILE